MTKSRSGFTIVELLIVIVVIGILAAITIVAYNGIQQRARDTSRASDISSIQKALELFRAEKGRYPLMHGAGTNVPNGFTGRYSSSYAYSVATDDSWLRELRASGFLTDIPKDPINDNSHYYIYYSAVSIGVCTEPVYVLIAFGWEGGAATMPPNARTLVCTDPGVITANWAQDNNQAVFSNLASPSGS